MLQNIVIKNRLLAVLLPLLLWQANSHGEPLQVMPLVRAALEKLDATNLDDDWYFTMDVDENDEHLVIQSDPVRDKYARRQLLKVNGETPDEQRQEKFRDTEVERVDGVDPEEVGYRYMVDAETLQLIESDDSYTRLSFTPRIKALEDSRDKMRGMMLLNSETQQIDEIEILNIENLSPAFSVTVHTYRLTLQFRQEQGETLLKNLESHAVGKAGFVKNFDSLVRVSFRDYRRSSPANPDQTSR